jgi:hypothetical protein
MRPEPRTLAEYKLLEALRELAPGLGLRSRCAATALLEYGTFYTVVPLPAELRRHGPRAMKQCYRNAADLATDRFRGFEYVEGFALTTFDGDIDKSHVFQHAWCEIRSGVAIDPTLRKNPPVALLGVTIPEVWNLLVGFRTHGPYLGHVELVTHFHAA